MSPFQRRYKFPIVTVAILISLFYFSISYTIKKRTQVSNNVQAQVLGIETKETPQGNPAHIIIPAIGVNADIQYVGVNADGEMGVPTNFFDVGWFKPGFKPGENGNAVMAGHFNGPNGETGVFASLYKLRKGDKLYVEQDNGTFVTFSVRETRTFDSGYADDVFSQSDSAHLNLVTCFGIWNEDKKSYSKRLVVFTDIEPNTY